MRLPALPIAIETERLLLRPWRVEDAPALYEAVIESRERVGQWLPWVKYYTEPAAAMFFIEQSIAGWATGTELPLGIFERETGRILGGAGMHSTWLGTPIRWDWGSFETGYWLRDGAEDKGYVRETVRAEIRLIFEHFKAHKLTIRCDVRNHGSRHVAEALGLALDVRARNDSIGTDGTVRTTLFFSMLATEARAAIASWPEEHYALQFDESATPIHFTPLSGKEEASAEAVAFARPVAIESDRLILRPPIVEDAPAWFELIERSRAELEAWISDYKSIHTLEEAEAALRESEENTEARSRYDLFAFEKETGKLIGGGALHGFVWSVPAVEIDWWLDSNETGKGYATEIGGMQAHFAFQAWQARRVEVWAEPGNTGSVRVAERIGCQYEGTTRNEYPNADGSLSGWAIYSLVPDDLPALSQPLPPITYETD
jgi:RimJ/RimL family protein N-acetyltransferase